MRKLKYFFICIIFIFNFFPILSSAKDKEPDSKHMTPSEQIEQEETKIELEKNAHQKSLERAAEHEEKNSDKPTENGYGSICNLEPELPACIGGGQ